METLVISDRLMSLNSVLIRENDTNVGLPGIAVTLSIILVQTESIVQGNVCGVVLVSVNAEQWRHHRPTSA